MSTQTREHEALRNKAKKNPNIKSSTIFQPHCSFKAFYAQLIHAKGVDCGDFSSNPGYGRCHGDFQFYRTQATPQKLTNV